MKYKFDENQRAIFLQFERGDAKSLSELKHSLQGLVKLVNSPEYKLLAEYFKLAREQIIAGSKKTGTNLQWAFLDGFDQGVIIPEILIERLEAYIDEKESEIGQEDQNGTESDGA